MHNALKLDHTLFFWLVNVDIDNQQQMIAVEYLLEEVTLYYCFYC